MQKLKYVFLIFLLSFLKLSSQTDSNSYFVKIENINIDSSIVNANDNIIIISTKNNLTINYNLIAPQNSPKEDFYYKIIFTNGFDSAVHTTGFNSLNYSSLQKGKYILDISAFALRGNWKTNSQIIKIVVDDSLAKIANEVYIFQQDMFKAKSSNFDTIALNKKSSVSIPRYFLYISIVILLLFLGIIFALISKNKSKQKSIRKGDVNKVENQENISTAKVDSVIKEENQQLKSEINELRAQIDTANIRAIQLSNKNKELESKIEALLKTKDSLEELNQQKDELFALIIHDIKNPAAIIKNLVDLLRSYDLTANEQMEVIQDIAETSQKILDLSIEVTLVLSIESGKMVLNFEKNKINGLIEDVVSKNQAIAKKKNIKLFTELPDNLPEVEMDYRRISEAIDNLISNAIKFTEEKGTVRVRAFKEGGNINVEVSDNGLGLSEEDVEKAFRWGQKLSAQPTGGEPSSGLGLWIVKKIIDSHNGRVWIKSALGKGSTFAFSFPIKKKE